MTHQSKIALVTGANKGVGRHITRQLAQAGVSVLASSRDTPRGQRTVDELRAEGLDVQLLQLDVTDAASVAAAAAQVTALDILVNNAGISSGYDTPSRTSPEDLRRTYETNVFGVVAVTNAFLPVLLRSPSPRIVNVSSEVGSLTLMRNRIPINVGAYQSSKAALNALTILYAKELRDTPVKINAVTPGYVATDLYGGTPTPGAGDPAHGAAVAVRFALLDDNGPSGEFHDASGILPW
ncbi:SDR family NAD(P)-dependent oxidoreductase [Micromonospora sp. NPDC048909]|uniref:SDR family NAD(P)-dependent oxidoreductase n=1 Tax=Micromonospora sp. NPDC048909 TaxID=3155643 RepID=UPI0033F92AD8